MGPFLRGFADELTKLGEGSPQDPYAPGRQANPFPAYSGGGAAASQAAPWRPSPGYRPAAPAPAAAPAPTAKPQGAQRSPQTVNAQPAWESAPERQARVQHEADYNRNRTGAAATPVPAAIKGGVSGGLGQATKGAVGAGGRAATNQIGQRSAASPIARPALPKI